jgi:hypothetical protein
MIDSRKLAIAVISVIFLGNLFLYAQGESFDDSVIRTVENDTDAYANRLDRIYEKNEPVNSIEEEERLMNLEALNDDHRYDDYESDDDYGNDYANDMYDGDNWFSDY